MAPLVIGTVRDEPDFARGSVLAVYDHSVGRLGSDLTLHVAGSDDSTDHRLVVRTEIAVDLTEHPDVIGALVATAAFECQEAFPEVGSQNEEYGVSRVRFDFTSKPYAYIAGQIKGQPGHVNALYATYATGDDGLLSGGEVHQAGNFGQPPKAGQPEAVVFKFDDVVTTTVIRLVVGIENELHASSNDWTYTIRFRSHWLLQKLQIGIA